MEVTMYSETMEARDLWVAAYMLANGCEFIRAIPNGARQHHWLFKNTDDKAYQLLYEWRDREHAAMVDGHRLAEAYKFLVNESRRATFEEGMNEYEQQSH
jgi:hypothetical protein